MTLHPLTPKGDAFVLKLGLVFIKSHPPGWLFIIRIGTGNGFTAVYLVLQKNTVFDIIQSKGGETMHYLQSSDGSC